jgi:hypothetical protein
MFSLVVSLLNHSHESILVGVVLLTSEELLERPSEEPSELVKEPRLQLDAVLVTGARPGQNPRVYQ